MLDAISLSDLSSSGVAVPALPSYIRARGRLSLRLKKGPHKSTIVDLHEAGGYRLKFPRADQYEAMIVNTGGGLAGGDQLHFDLALDDGATAVVSTQSAEKIYRAESDASEVNLDFTLAPQTHLYWLPQESIVFDGACLRRKMQVHLAPTACFAAFEGFVFGRQAMGETVRVAHIEDDWMIRREGRLIFAERLRLSGDLTDQLARPALGHGARVAATFLYVAPDAESRLDEARCLLDDYQGFWGASAWNGLLTIRFLDSEPARLRRQAIVFLQTFLGFALPRVWQC